MRIVKTFKLNRGEATFLEVSADAEVLAARKGSVYVIFDDAAPTVKLGLFSAEEGRHLPMWASKPSYLGSYEEDVTKGKKITCHVFRMPEGA